MEVVEREGDAFVQKQDAEGHTFVHWAALGGYNELINYLLDKGAPFNEHSNNDYGPRPIHWACVHGNVTTVNLFLEKGVAIDTTDYNGCSPLLIASQYGQSLVISFLLQKGANKFHVDSNGDSALHWASFKGVCVCVCVCACYNFGEFLGKKLGGFKFLCFTASSCTYFYILYVHMHMCIALSSV